MDKVEQQRDEDLVGVFTAYNVRPTLMERAMGIRPAEVARGEHAPELVQDFIANKALFLLMQPVARVRNLEAAYNIAMDMKGPNDLVFRHKEGLRRNPRFMFSGEEQDKNVQRMQEIHQELLALIEDGHAADYKEALAKYAQAVRDPRDPTNVVLKYTLIRAMGLLPVDIFIKSNRNHEKD